MCGADRLAVMCGWVYPVWPDGLAVSGCVCPVWPDGLAMSGWVCPVWPDGLAMSGWVCPVCSYKYINLSSSSI